MSSQPTPPSDYVPAQLIEPAARGPVRVIIERPPGSWIGRVVRWGLMLLLALVVFGFMFGERSGLEEEWHSLSTSASNKVAIVKIEGTIFETDGYVIDQIDQVLADDDVKAVVLRVDSPGGTVTGSDYIYHRLKKMVKKKEVPLVVSMGGIAASGGYYVAMAAGDLEDTIYAEPTTWTGSIGVIIPHYNVAKLLERWDIEDDSVASNPLKMMGSPTREFPEPIREEEQKILRGLVESSFADFKEIVLSNRPALRDDQEKQDVVFTGRIFTAKQAQENLLVDKLGFIEDAIERAIKLANLDKDDVQAVEYKQPVGAIDALLFGGRSRSAKFEPLDLSALFELTVPRAYYLCTWLPALGGLTTVRH